ncbi:hypothetical protein [Pedobacter kyungheensis]|nr:hypothetical protein [Pedobacter kyungheensis]
MKLFLTILVLFLGYSNLNAQQIPDSLKFRAQQFFYQRLLHIDSSKARRVALLQVDHKDRVKDVYGRFDLNTQGKAKILSDLDSTRLSKLAQILDPKELNILKKIGSN